MDDDCYAYIYDLGIELGIILVIILIAVNCAKFWAWHHSGRHFDRAILGVELGVILIINLVY